MYLFERNKPKWLTGFRIGPPLSTSSLEKKIRETTDQQSTHQLLTDNINTFACFKIVNNKRDASNTYITLGHTPFSADLGIENPVLIAEQIYIACTVCKTIEIKFVWIWGYRK